MKLRIIVRKGIVSDKPVNKDVKTTGTMHIIEPMAFIPDIPERYYGICDKYIKENVIMKSEYIAGLNPNSYKH